jgi:hypothetical protein
MGGKKHNFRDNVNLASHSSGISVQELTVSEDGLPIPVEEIEKLQVSELLNSPGKVYLLGIW